MEYDWPLRKKKQTYVIGNMRSGIRQLRRFNVQGHYSLSGQTSHRKILWSLEGAGFEFNFCIRSEISQACQVLERYDHYNIK